jgi:hypothetical protein
VINFDRNFIFCHNQKTAGTSMACALSRLSGCYYVSTNMFEWAMRGRVGGIETMPLSEEMAFDYPNKHNPMIFWSKFVDLGNFFSFGFVRNPKVRMVALYLQQIREAGPGKGSLEITIDEDTHKVTKLPIGTHEFTFDFFVRTYIPLAGKNQVAQFYDSDNNIIADFVGKYENIDSDWKTVCQHLGVSHLPLPRKRVSADYNISDFWTGDLLEFFFSHEFYSDEYEVFGYEKG